MQNSSNVFSRPVFQFIPALLLTGIATALAFAPQWFPPPLALACGLLLLLLFPGYLLERILFAARELSLTRLAVFFAFSLAVWAIPATALQILGAPWFAFRVVFVGVLWLLTFAAIFLRRHPAAPPPSVTRAEFLSELALGGVLLIAAFVVARGPRDGDDWLYLQIIQQFMASDVFQIFERSEVRYSIRFAAHVWLFLQAFLGRWLDADVVVVAREILPTLLAPLGLVSMYAWGKTFFGSARAALAAVVIQFAIYATFARGDAWGLGFFARSAQDKFLVWLVLFPVALCFAWRVLRDGKFADWFAYGTVILAALWVHPVSLYGLVLTLGGFALFNLCARVPFPRRRWLALLAATLPVLLTPLLIRATTLPVIFTVNTPDVAAYLRLSQGRLLFQPPFYIADPALLAHPALLGALALLLWFAPRVRADVRVQFLWGSTLAPLALLFNPYTARLLGEMLTPWQLWRMTWNIPAAFILVAAGAQLLAHARERQLTRWQWAARVLALSALGVGVFWLADLNLARSWKNITSTHALEPPVAALMEYLRVTLRQPALVLLPRDLTRYAPAYTYNALVLTGNAHLREGPGGAEIDRFYNERADEKFFETYLQKYKIEYVVAENESPHARFLETRARTAPVYRNAEFTLYRLAP